MPTKKQITRDTVIATKGRRCIYCGKGPLYKRALHMDHVVPRVSGGSDDADNLVPACKACNIRKGGKDIDVYVRMRMAQLTEERNRLKSILEELESVDMSSYR